LIDLVVTGMTGAVVMIEAGEEMTEEILDETITETSAETIDVAMIGITVTGEMTAEILSETMIGIVQNATIPTLLEE
jgi:predicted LPLAT superfamily acyltransferase